MMNLDQQRQLGAYPARMSEVEVGDEVEYRGKLYAVEAVSEFPVRDRHGQPTTAVRVQFSLRNGRTEHLSGKSGDVVVLRKGDPFAGLI